MADFYQAFSDNMGQLGFPAPAALFATTTATRYVVQALATALADQPPSLTMAQLQPILAQRGSSQLASLCSAHRSDRALSYFAACLASFGAANWSANWQGRRVPPMLEISHIDIGFIIAEHHLQISSQQSFAVRQELQARARASAPRTTLPAALPNKSPAPKSRPKRKPAAKRARKPTRARSRN